MEAQAETLTIPEFCYIQLQPLPAVPKPETAEQKAERQKWFYQQVEDFKTWASHDSPYLLMIPGYTTHRFLFITNYQPAETDYDKRLQDFIDDVQTACVYGDQGATVDGQRYNTRARWKKSIKGSWDQPTEMGVATSAGTLTRVAQRPKPATYNPPRQRISFAIWTAILTILTFASLLTYVIAKI